MKKAIQLSYHECMDDHFLKKVKEAGFDGVDFAFFQDFFMAEDKDRIIESVREKLDHTGLTCAQVHLPYYNIFASSELFDEEMEHRIHYSLAAMSRLGAKWGALHPLSATNFSYDRKRALNDNIEKIKGYLETASKYNVGIAVENIPVFADCPQYLFYTSKAQDHCELIDRINSPLVAACWDIGHAHLNMAEPDKIKALRTLGNRVKILHVHNNYTNRDWHLCPAFGTVNWDEIMDTLSEIGYSGFFSLECVIGRRNKKIKTACMQFCAEATDAIIYNTKEI